MGILYPLGFEEQKNPALKDGIRHKIQNLRSLKQKTDGASRSSAQIENIKRQSPFYTPADGILRQTGGHAEGHGFKKIAVQDQTAGLPMQELYPVPGLVNEDIDISVARVTSQLISHYSTQCVVTLTHVSRPVV